MDADSLLSVFERNARLIQTNLDGLAEAELQEPLANGGNSIAWLLGHIVFWRHMLASPGGDEAQPPPERVLIFRGLDRGDYPGLADWSVSEIQARLAESEGMVRSALASDECDLERAAQLLWHEAYHIGQLGVLRRVLGHTGAAGRG